MTCTGAIRYVSFIQHTSHLTVELLSWLAGPILLDSAQPTLKRIILLGIDIFIQIPMFLTLSKLNMTLIKAIEVSITSYFQIQVNLG